MYTKYYVIVTLGRHDSKCSKILKTFLFMFFLNKVLICRAGIYKMLVIIANREDPDQAASTVLFV